MFKLSTRARALPRIAALAAGLTIANAPVWGQTPSAYQDLYSTLDSKLTSFKSSLQARAGNSAKAPVIFSAGLLTANGNAGATLLGSTRRAAVQLEMDRLYSIGVRAVTVNISFPLFFQPFFAYNGTAAQYDQFIDFYKFVGSEARRRGMYFIVETGVLFPGFYSTGSGFNLGGFYSTLNANSYATGRAATAALIAKELQPDFLSVGAEPDNEAALTGVSAIGSPSGWLDVMRTIVREVRNSGSQVPVGAGVGTWAPNATAYVDSIVASGADYVDLHVYPINGNLLDATVSLADYVASKGVRVAVTEAWMLKQRDSEFSTVNVASDPAIFARDAFSFWAPLDQKFLDTMTLLAQNKSFVFISPFWSKYFWSYLNYNDVAQMTATQITEASNAAAAQAILGGGITPTGTAYSRLERTKLVNVLSAASFSTTSLASDIHASAFGADLATATSQATSIPLPTSLGGTSVTVTDKSGTERPASMVFASPGQVNFLMPSGMQPGWGKVTVRSASSSSESQVMLRNVAPGVFSANFRGSGLAAAIVTIVRADGSRVDNFVANCASDGNCTSVPADLGSDTDRAVLSLYGTGIRGRSSLDAVRVIIGNVSLTPMFAGPQPQYPGLDQVNVELPKSLRGAGVANVQLVVDNARANVVTVQIR